MIRVSFLKAQAHLLAVHYRKRLTTRLRYNQKTSEQLQPDNGGAVIPKRRAYGLLKSSMSNQTVDKARHYQLFIQVLNTKL